MRLDEELESESDAETVKHLKNAQMYRTNLRELSIGTIKFISQLFNVGFLKSRVIELCMKSLLGKGKNSTEHDVECFCVLLTNIGENLETAPKGAEIIEENLEIMEQIVDSQGDTFVLKTRCLILDVFELRANHWTPVGPEQVSPPKIQAKEVTEMFERKRETREFLKEVNDVVGKLKREKMLDFINCFVGAQFSKDRLDGLVHIIFEKAISSPETSMFAIVCNGLGYICAEKITEQGDHMMPTFRDFLLRLIRHEVDVVRHKASDFRTILMRLEILKQEEVKTAVEQLKELIENDIRLASRAAAVATFIGELYNAKFFESRFIFDEVFIVLVDPQFISNTTIECFVKLVKTCGIKMITEKNRSVLMKETLMRLLAAAEKITITEKSKFLIKDVLNFSRFQLKLEVSNNFEETVLNSPQLNFHWSSKLLDWNSKSPARSGSKRSKKVYNINDSDDKKFAARQFVPTAVPSMDHFTRISPSNVS